MVLNILPRSRVVLNMLSLALLNFPINEIVTVSFGKKGHKSIK